MASIITLDKKEIEEMTGYSLKELNLDLVYHNAHHKDLFDVDAEDLKEMFKRVKELSFDEAYSERKNRLIQWQI